MDLKFGSVCLRAIEVEDCDFLKDLINNPSIEYNVVGKSYSVSKKDELEWIQQFRNSDHCIRWIIESNSKRIGTFSFVDIDWINRTASSGIKIDGTVKDRNKGDIKDAFYAALAYAFDELNLHRINSDTLDYNFFSLKLQKTLGFKQEGIQRKRVFKNGNYHDLIILGLLNEEFTRYEDGAAPWQKS